MTLISEIIRKRYSCRSYSLNPVEESILQKFRQQVNEHIENAREYAALCLISMAVLPRAKNRKSSALTASLKMHGFILRD